MVQSRTVANNLRGFGPEYMMDERTWIVELAGLIRELVADTPDGVPMGPCYMAFMQHNLPLPPSIP